MLQHDPLPIEAVVPEVRAALRDRGAAVLTAPPGSGKTTIVPLRLLEEPWLAGRKIVVLEPRRLATRAAARWMARLLGEEAGSTVGYVTRTDRRTGPATRIEVVTEGVLTRRLQRDAELPDTAAVLFDELHERNLQTDLGMALTLDTRRVLRPDLRVLAMSATIDAARVAGLIGGDDDPVPVIEGEARVHPVEVRWVPPGRQTRLEGHVAATIRKVLAAEYGDVLVFLPGLGEMRRIERDLIDAGLPADVRLLHGSLPFAEQDAAIAPSPPGRRKVVLSTDIAETSLTVEGIRAVIDSGLARKPRFDARTGMTRLRTVPISRASADQRAGRAGRIEPGIACRLWSKLEHGGRNRHITPEIAQVDLAGFALELAAWGSRAEEMSFLDMPPHRTLEEAGRLLEQLGALDAEGRMTIVGGMMATLPLHPRLARMVVDAGPDAALACIVAALLDDRDVLRGHPNDLPADLAVRVRLVADPGEGHPQAVGSAIGRVRDTARDLARRAGVGWGAVDADRTGIVLALAYPDRLALRRGTPGRFQLRTRTTAWMPDSDGIAAEQFLVVGDLDGKRKDARIRLAAAIDAEHVLTAFAHEVDERADLAWEGDRLVQRTEQRLGGLVLRTVERRPDPGPRTAAAIAKRIESKGMRELPWTRAALDLSTRVTYLHRTLGDPWPDWSDAALSAGVADWLAGPLAAATGLDDLAGLDLRAELMRRLTHRLVADLDELAPTHVEVPSGRRLPVDYSGDSPVLSVRVQEMYGAAEGPCVAGRPLRLELLSPADRPIQITQDLAGFWSGSWAAVRKEMAGRYPKHDWPEDPAAASPSRR